jgi:hypothetical protein
LKHERAASAVPPCVRWLLAASLCLQIAWQWNQPDRSARAQALSAPLPVAALRIASLGEPIVASQLLTLYLQAFDNQPGISIPFRELDYGKVEAWLSAILALDPVGQYPLLMACYLYAQVPDEQKRRRMFDFAYREFFKDPNRRWPWLAHAAIMAKHRLKDLSLALDYAQAIAHHATSAEVPSWARQMHLLLLAEMGELESAKTLFGALLASGVIIDPREIHFLQERLKELESVESSSSAAKN